MQLETEARARPAEAESFDTGQVLTIVGAHAVHDTYTGFLPPLLPLFVQNLALSRTEAGLLTVFNQAPSLLQPFIGHLADRASLRTLVILAPAIGGVTMSLLGVAPSYALLALLLVVSGINSAALHSVAPVMAGRLSGRSLGRGMGLWMLGGELGRALGPIIVVTAVEVLGLPGTPWLMIAGFLASALLYVRLRDVPVTVARSADPLPWRRLLGIMGPFLVPLIAIITVRAFMISSLTTYLPLFLTEEGADLWFAGASLSLLEGAGVAGALLGGSLSDRLGRRLVMGIALLVTPVLMFLFLLADGWLRIPLLLALGLTALSVIPVLMALVQESFPENRALANGVYMALSFLIRSAAVLVVGAIGDAWGMRLAFTISAVAPLLGLPFLWLFPKGRR
ncbi:MAG TPA: MFS transporter [Anaerolineae bacterium]|nr:MFS transporter [Anaerolineae bacterium]